MFRWLRPRIEVRGEILFPPQPPAEIHIVMAPQPRVEEEPPQDLIEYGPLRLVGDDEERDPHAY